jgi:hypothetical protein
LTTVPTGRLNDDIFVFGVIFFVGREEDMDGVMDGEKDEGEEDEDEDEDEAEDEDKDKDGEEEETPRLRLFDFAFIFCLAVFIDDSTSPSDTPLIPQRYCIL